MAHTEVHCLRQALSTQGTQVGQQEKVIQDMINSKSNNRVPHLQLFHLQRQLPRRSIHQRPRLWQWHAPGFWQVTSCTLFARAPISPHAIESPVLFRQEWVERVGSSHCFFMNRLSDIIKEELSVWDERGASEELISLAVRLDNRLREKRRAKVGGTDRLSSAHQRLLQHLFLNRSSRPAPHQSSRAHTAWKNRQQNAIVGSALRLCIYWGISWLPALSSQKG